MNGDVIELIHIAVEKEAKAAPVISMFLISIMLYHF
jgi:hypothetical protein